MKDKSLLILILILFTIAFTSCEDDANDIVPTTQNLPIQNPAATSKLNGNWLLQNLATGSSLSFNDTSFTMYSGTVTITGTYSLTGMNFSGMVTSRLGANSAALAPDHFTGIVAFSSNDSVVTFTNFTGNWYAVFSTWYKKI